MITPHEDHFFDNIRMTKPCFYALVDALTSRGLLPHGQTSRVSSIEEVAFFMQTVGMHKRQRDNMERFQHSLETIHRRFHRVLSALCAMAPGLITRPNFTEIHTRIANNPDFFPFFKDCVGAMDGTLVPAWVPRGDQIRYRSRKGGLAQNVLAICDFDMNFTYVYAGSEGSAADARVLDHAVSHDPTFPFPEIGKYYLVDAGFTNNRCFLAPYRGTRSRNVIERCFGVLKKRFPILQWGMPSYLLDHQVDIVIACCTLHNFIRKFSNDDLIFNETDEDTPADMEIFYHRGHPTTYELESQRLLRDSIAMQIDFMWMIMDDNTRAPMRDDALAEAQMGHWARALRRHFGYPYTRNQGDAQDNESSNSLCGPVRGGVDAPIVISDSAAPSVQTHTHIASWDAVEHVARGDGGPRLARSTSLAARHSLDMGSEVGGIGPWTDYIHHFGVHSDRGAQTNSDGDSTARSHRPQGLPPRRRDGP
ncbi:UNVERIFIED_CONTAM: hypothetical protein Slati_0165000 [Sesamum latifolium]|uniref:DDE Tnp4 domain-containing protein n=1 Tax=Sesamum latifolium TaxID=2727402 RepID=A0AAW2YAJ2_9LAMI